MKRGQQLPACFHGPVPWGGPAAGACSDAGLLCKHSQLPSFLNRLPPPLLLPCLPSLLQVCVYDPEVDANQIYQDLGTEKFEWDHPSPRSKPLPRSALDIGANAMDAAAGSHAICVLTEWDEFKSLDYKTIYDSMMKPAFLFDGRNILDHAALRWAGEHSCVGQACLIC